MNDQNNPQSEDQNQVPPETRAFLESLLDEVHMEHVDEAQKEQMLSQLYARLDYFLTAKIIDALSDADLEVFTKMNEEGRSREEVEAFILEKIPNAQDVFKDAFLEFREVYVGAGREMEAEEQQASSTAQADETQSSAPVMPNPAPAMDTSTPEDVPPPPPAPVPPTQSDDENNGSGPMVN